MDNAETIIQNEDLAETDARVERLPFTFAQAHGVLLQYDNEQPHIFYRPGLKVATLLELRRSLGQSFTSTELSEGAFQQRLTQAYQKDNNEAVQVAEDMGSDIDLTRLADEIPDTADLMDADDDAPVIRLINAVLSQAVREQASDIHIETFEDKLTVRFRIDGILTEVLSPKRMLAPLLVSRLKVMAKLDIAEKRVPQDGRISIRLAGHAVDIRVSTIPSAHGERVVLRLLDKQAGQLHLDQLQMNQQVHEAYTKALHTPHGIILVTGPTGSGKTTTLYAGLTHINQSSRNILTIEDPVEYLLPGIGQTQVNSKVDMTFARGLRAILRQDPDVVMVGEIRDTETAEIAVQASLTGHLVLSTLHTNTAVGAITRLQDMGVEPFLLSSSIIGVLAQRLVRVLCDHCKEEHGASEGELALLGMSGSTEEVTIYRAVGCDHCNQSGYKGRTGIYEMIEIDDDLRVMIHEGVGEQEMLTEARKRAGGILDDGRRRVLAGETTVEEVLRVTAA
ncbi:MAG: type II secretion system ATPase GspE [Oceanicoccus sp.]|uniref:type II secretion system ATPase GspE n=1 Tax=Oceanicoccus sp. TaxID=2691044 RepID=UPI002637388E|nr:type II secretion system ATPase GspE [Oceanicoccus sp.]MCP3908216.1 type II secretion system ATPase GspE [Oceanicoccus sp.]MDG1773876.1 type II secretion system ATPase GspE [Oceanicoccus sp.]